MRGRRDPCSVKSLLCLDGDMDEGSKLKMSRDLIVGTVYRSGVRGEFRE